MDVEFITDEDMESALLQWCARRRREVVTGSAYLSAELLIFADVGLLWRHQSHLSIAFIAAMLFQILAFAVAAIARDPDRPVALPCPHAEIASLLLVAVSLIVTFEHHPSVTAFLLLAVVFTAAAAIAVRGWYGFEFARRYVPFNARVVHVHLNPQGLEITVRPRPRPRLIEWKKVRYVGADSQSLFVVAGWIPAVVPRSAFGSRRAWDDFVEAVAAHTQTAQASLKSGTRSPIRRYGRAADRRTRRRRPRSAGSGWEGDVRPKARRA
jgi:hypothetical protein